MLYYKQAVADTENKSIMTTEVQLMRFEKKRQKSLKKLLTNTKQHVKLYKLSLERVTSKKRTLIIE